MSGITTFMVRACQQTAVYWAPLGEDGYGKKTFYDPIEVSCRWQDVKDLVLSGNGKEVITRATVYVTTDVEEEGYLYLGTLDTLYDSAESSEVTLDPMDYADAGLIVAFYKSPVHRSTTEFVRKAYLQ